MDCDRIDFQRSQIKSAGTNSDEAWIPPRIDRWFKVRHQVSLQNHTLLFHAAPTNTKDMLNEPEIQVTHPLTYWWTIFPPTLSQSQIQSQQGRIPKALCHSLEEELKSAAVRSFLCKFRWKGRLEYHQLLIIISVCIREHAPNWIIMMFEVKTRDKEEDLLLGCSKELG